MTRTKLTVALSILGIATLVLLTGCSDESSSDTVTTAVEATEESFYQIDEVDDEGRQYLSPQDVGPEVTKIQERFASWDLPAEVTGTYDDQTLALVLAFQYSQGLTPDGVVGPQTWDALASPESLPEELDPLDIIEIAQVAVESPSDARTLVEEYEAETGFDPYGRNETPADTGPGAESEGGSTGDPAAGASRSGLHAVVSLEDQRTTLLDANGDPIAEYPVSSGADGLTPVGEFRVQSKSPQAWAESGGDVTMLWMTRFNGGIGFHGIPVKSGTPLETPLGERPVSHGCIRMADDDAKELYDTLPVGAPVIVQY